MTNWGSISWPRQCSCSPEWPGYEAWKDLYRRGYNTDIFLDGVEQKMVYAWDLDACTLVCAALGADGNVILVGDHIKTVVKKGRITLKPRPHDGWVHY